MTEETLVPLDESDILAHCERQEQKIKVLETALTEKECHHENPYYDPESDNYYCSKCKKGMGQSYFIAMTQIAALTAERDNERKELKEIKEEIKRKNEYVDNFHGLGKRPLKDTIRVENEIALNQSETQWLNR